MKSHHASGIQNLVIIWQDSYAMKTFKHDTRCFKTWFTSQSTKFTCVLPSLLVLLSKISPFFFVHQSVKVQKLTFFSSFHSLKISHFLLPNSFMSKNSEKSGKKTRTKICLLCLQLLNDFSGAQSCQPWAVLCPDRDERRFLSLFVFLWTL